MSESEKNRDKIVSDNISEVGAQKSSADNETILSRVSEEPAKIITSSGHRHHHSSKSGKSRKRHHRSKRKKIIKKVLLIVGIILLLAAIITAGSIAVLYHTGKNEMKPDKVKIEAPKNVETVDDGRYIYYKNGKYKYKDDIINMMFLGIDRNNGLGTDGIGANGQADVIAIAAIDSAKSKVTIINVPRDIITDVKVFSSSGGYSGTEKMQIALSFAYGDGGDTSCVNTISALRSLFYNVPISPYSALKMDSIGGVDVTSPETISIFEKGQKYHLDGEDALLFVQRRDMESVNANLKRNERQKVYLNSFISKFTNQTKSDIGVPINVFNASKPYSFTNLNANRITYLATEFILNKKMAIQMKSVPVTVEKQGNNAANYVKEEQFYELFLDVFYEKVK